MTHDPLCKAPLCDYTGRVGSECMGYEDCSHDCQCDLIERARKDEHDKAMIILLDHLLDNGHITAQLGYEKGLVDAINSIKTAYMRDSIAVRSQTEWGVELALNSITALEGKK